mgnify:CR=1 FL=1
MSINTDFKCILIPFTDAIRRRPIVWEAAIHTIDKLISVNLKKSRDRGSGRLKSMLDEQGNTMLPEVSVEETAIPPHSEIIDRWLLSDIYFNNQALI